MLKARSVFNTVFLMAAGYVLYSYLILPDNPAIHFGGGGAPNDWASKPVYLLIMLGVLGLVYLSFRLAPGLIRGVPVRYISLPNRDYWLAEENRAEAAARLESIMYSFGTVTGLMLIVMTALTVRANQSDPVRLNEGAAWLTLILYLGYTAWWTVRLLLAFRVPKDRRGPSQNS